MITLRQKRAHAAALEKAAAAPTKRWLGRSVLLTGIQSGWVKSLLSVWGEGVKGGATPMAPRSHACWRGFRSMKWSDKTLERFTEALTKARAEGFRGQQALNRAQAILWPTKAPSVIDEALNNDDVDFIEKCILEAFDLKDPVYIIGMSFYTTRKKISDLSRELNALAPWLTSDEARKRVRWCLEIFRARVYLVARKHLSEE